MKLERRIYKDVICYTYQQLLLQKTTLVPGSKFSRHDGSIFNWRIQIAKKTTGIASINKTQLSAFPVVLPSMSSQEQFVKQVALIESIQSQQAAATATAQATFDALLAQVFSTERVAV